MEEVPAERLPMPPQRGRRRWFWGAGSLAAAAALAIAVVRPGWVASRAAAPVHRAATPIGGFESVTLADGSVVRLNTATEIAVDFSAHERRVALLRGEASFEVAKDPARPFIVRAGEIDVCAVGTVFNVRQGEQAIEVLVTEGKVRVEEVVAGEALTRPSAGEPAKIAAVPLLAAGQRATFVRPTASVAAKASVAEVAPAESARALAWHSREVEFSNEPLDHIAAEFNRYNPHRLVVADPELGQRRFGGKFPANDFAALVRLLELNFGVVVERRENETVLRRGPAGR
jgi:transmembrane sensor